jgi:hypothetical protein
MAPATSSSTSNHRTGRGVVLDEGSRSHPLVFHSQINSTGLRRCSREEHSARGTGRPERLRAGGSSYSYCTLPTTTYGSGTSNKGIVCSYSYSYSYCTLATPTYGSGTSNKGIVCCLLSLQADREETRCVRMRSSSLVFTCISIGVLHCGGAALVRFPLTVCRAWYCPLSPSSSIPSLSDLMLQ